MKWCFAYSGWEASACKRCDEGDTMRHRAKKLFHVTAEGRLRIATDHGNV